MKPTKTRVCLLCWLTLMAVGVVLSAKEPKVFSHAEHFEEGAEECDLCHKTQEGKPMPVLSREGCEDCHDDGPPAPWKLLAPGRRLEIRFGHSMHAEAQECGDCHRATIDGSHKPQTPFLTLTGCKACHQENDVEVPEGRCGACHGENRRRIPPADHAHAWTRRHGNESRWRVFDRHGQACSLCHPNDGCRTCHQTTRPKSHHALWRNRSHGIEAGWDRQACKTCHNAGACIRCHRSNAPLNHKGAWRSLHGLAAQSRGNRHCTVCHSRAWCAACHAGGGR